MRVILMFAFAVFALTPSMVSAQCSDPFLELPEGQVMMNLSATERKEVEQDLLVATLAYVGENRDARALQNEINTAMKKALDLSKQEKNIKVNTGSYQVYERADPRTKEKKWHGRQTLTLKSKKADDLLELAGKLQDMKLMMNGLNYMLAPETSVSIQDSLMEDALRQLQTRADRAAKALGKSGAVLRDVSIQNNRVPYQQTYQSRGAHMEMAAMDMAAPVASAGETTITLTVSARALLLP